MALFNSIVRSKELALALHRQSLGDLLRQREQARYALNAGALRLKDMQRQLRVLLSQPELQVQHLGLARAQIDRAQQRVTVAQAQLREHERGVSAQELVVLKARKELEKLGELYAERMQLEADAKQQREWNLLDEWIVARHPERT